MGGGEGDVYNMNNKVSMCLINLLVSKLISGMRRKNRVDLLRKQKLFWNNEA